MIKQIAQIFRKKDELIGIWTREDDGSGLLNSFGWSLHFSENGKGISYSREGKAETNYDFEWKRENKNQILIRAGDKNWEKINYQTEKYIGAYASKQIKLKEVGKDKFWNSPEPLFKRR